jgi:uncharacterized protein YgbK (DUF1537 family)
MSGAISNDASKPKLVVVADDLTGTADSAARCVQVGLSAEIWMEAPDGTDPNGTNPNGTNSNGTNSNGTNDVGVATDVVSVSTDSRFLPAEEAAQRVKSTLTTLLNHFTTTGVTWYKKIDSTLRGNLGAELDAILAALSVSAAVICPAFPAQGRGLEGGKLVFDGAPPHYLPALLREQSKSPVSLIELAIVRQGVKALEQALREHRDQGERLLVVDGLTESDLATIVAATQSNDYLLCGSAGLVAPLAARWTNKGEKATTKSTSVADGSILAIVGSGSTIAHAQVAQVAAAEAMRVRELDKTWYEVDLIGAQSHPIGDWLIHLAPPADGMILEGAVARAQAARLADVAYAASERLQPCALLVVGGDTAYYVLRRLGIKRLAVVEELLPGIPLTVGVDREGCRRAVVLKPGNFGDAQTLVTLHRALQQRQL